MIDQDYRGNVGVVLFNHAKTDFEIKKGDRVAQLICEKIAYPELEEVTVKQRNAFFLVYLYSCIGERLFRNI